MQRGFLIERLTAGEWVRGGRVYWSRASVDRHAAKEVKRSTVEAVRILQFEVDLNAVAELPQVEVAAQ